MARLYQSLNKEQLLLLGLALPRRVRLPLDQVAGAMRKLLQQLVYDDFPFSCCSSLLIVTRGGTDTNRCTWSGPSRRDPSWDTKLTVFLGWARTS